MRPRSGLEVVSRQDSAKQERRLLSRRERAARFVTENPASATAALLGAGLLSALVLRGAGESAHRDDESSVRIFVHTPGEGTDRDAGTKELELLKKLPHKCTTVTPEALSEWNVVDGTAVLLAKAPQGAFDSKTNTHDYGIAAAAAEWFAALVALGDTWSRIVVIVETSDAHAWEPSYTCVASVGDGKREVTFTSYAGEERNALVFAPDCVVLIDQEAGSFFSCTLIRNMRSDVAQELTRDDYCAGTSGKRLRAESMYLCHQKVLAFARAEKLHRQSRKATGKEGHEIDGRYERIFVTSDVHADLRKLVQILSACGLITIENDSPTGIYALVDHKQKIHDLVWNVKWAVQKTMLVICGDLVDGWRGGGSVTGDDLGSYEFLLHCLLFNLRMQARRRASEVQFTIGNHDAGTVTGFKEKGSRISAWRYVEPKHWTFAPSCRSVEIAKAYRGEPMFWRRDMLLPFYACSPYVILTFGKVAFVHGGFVWGDARLGEEPNNAKNIFNDAIEMQKKLSDAPLEEGTDLAEFFESTNNAPDVTWARGYADLEHEEACDAENPAHQMFELIAVGHCITHDHKDKDLVHGQCGDLTGNTGCVLTRDCHGGPLIALVDTGMSATFRRNGQDNAKRAVGMLLLDERDLGTQALRKVGDHYVHRIRALDRMEVLDRKGEPVSKPGFGQSRCRYSRYV